MVSFRPQPVITEDNLVVEIDTVYFQVTDPRAAAYEIADFLQGVEQLTVTTLRNVVGSMDLEKTLTSRDTIKLQLRGVLDEATGKWGLRGNRVEIKAIDPPQSMMSTNPPRALVSGSLSKGTPSARTGCSPSSTSRTSKPPPRCAPTSRTSPRPTPPSPSSRTASSSTSSPATASKAATRRASPPLEGAFNEFGQ